MRQSSKYSPVVFEALRPSFSSAWQVEMLEDPVVVGDTPWYYASYPVQIEATLRGSRQGVSVLAIYETLDGELLVINHVYAGR